LLLAHGYGGTSVEAVARRAHISKRTFYHRFTGKTDLTMAVVVRLVDSVRPPAEVPLIEGASLHDILVHLGSLILHAALTPRVLALHRLIVAEAERFPDLASAVARAGGREEAVAFISALLARHSRNPALGADALRFAAEQLLQMIVSTPQLRAIGLGEPIERADLDPWVRATVGLFLEGFNTLAGPPQARPPRKRPAR
jgi:AcrR family transcriptional regulator